ncbi:TPA_asm: RNA-directed RNA polymerase [ssRNA phage Zoerhiza.1_23]|uniref:RNA-directed RNA polymerase n=2 Tax=Leviviricetes TaxID=2842243 RepID=A0A8S5KY39_9VIRU|nr:RNA-directed RNA polymerase [ssRNA phage Zoerhiza.1_23]QDH90795.1 MAG: RNA-dependent RNA polymerase [Leviviridae sp.]DAD50091.1 TPA_asm: RNA-directed RNA polymerase [ssRNA phage Zoerhiza.1_23]
MLHEVLLSTSNGRRCINIDDAYVDSLSVPVGENRDIVALFIASWISLLADSPLDPNKKPFRLYVDLLKEIAARGVKSTVVRYTDLAHRLVSQHSLYGSGTSIGDWIDEFRDTPVFKEYHRYYLTGDAKVLRYLYTFLNFGKKLDYVDESFNSTAFRGWIGIENKLNDWSYDARDLKSLKTILSHVLPTFSFSDIRPKFGPGAVQERGVKGRIGKLRSFQFDPLIDRFFFRGHTGMYGYGEDHGLSVSKVIPDPSRWSPANGVSSREARLRFVPKNLKVSRSICMEPNVLMFFQQAVGREFLRLIEQSPMSSFIDIRDQSRNRKLSAYGSYTGDIDTLDLSSASDSVSVALVRGIFPASWLIPMLVTRSHSAIVDGDKSYRLAKFAPMGSALCFPTQCLIFAAVCIYAACLRTYETESVTASFDDWLPLNVLRCVGLFARNPGYTERYFQPLAVYGDDICVDGSLTQLVKSILVRLGFDVNEEKSFVGAQAFRESCGGYYLNGHDITPLYFRIKGVRRKISASHVVSQVHMINESWDRGAFRLFRFLRYSITTWGCTPGRDGSVRTNPIPYVSDPHQFGIRSNSPKNKHLRSRVHPDYQRDEVRCWTISYDYKEQPGDLLSVVDAYEYMRWWAGRGGMSASEVDSSVSRYDTGGAGLRWRWIPLQE